MFHEIKFNKLQGKKLFFLEQLLYFGSVFSYEPLFH